MRILYYTICKVLCLMFATLQLSAATNIDTIDYRAQVWVEKEDMARYGGEAVFKANLGKMFQKTNYFWNESKHKFKHYFRFVPADIHIYDIEGNQDRYKEFEKKAYGLLDTEKYDFVVFLALNAKKNGLWCGGGGASGQSVVCCYQTLEEQQKRGDIFSKEIPEQGMYSNLGHEYGHVRGATDIYQYIIKAEDNPVSHEALSPPQCNMGNGMWAWSDYCSNLFNYTAYYKQLPKDLSKKVFPDKFRIKVLSKGKVKKDVTVKLYGTRAGGKNNKRDVYPHPYRELQTNKRGIVDLTDVYKLYHPNNDEPNLPPKDAFPYNYWFCFLIEADCNGVKKYVWVPDWETQITKMQGANIHKVTFNF